MFDTIISIVAIIISFVALFNSFLNDLIKALIIKIQIKHKPCDLVIKPTSNIPYNEFNEKYNNWLNKINGESKKLTIYGGGIYFGINLKNKEESELLTYVNFFRDDDIIDIIDIIYFTDQWKRLIKTSTTRKKNILSIKIHNLISSIKRKLNFKRKSNYYTKYEIARYKINNIYSKLDEETKKKYLVRIRCFDNTKKIKKNSFEYWNAYDEGFNLIIDTINSNEKVIQILEYEIIDINSDNENKLTWFSIIPLLISIISLVINISLTTIELTNYIKTINITLPDEKTFIWCMIILYFLVMIIIFFLIILIKGISINENNHKLNVYKKKLNKLNGDNYKIWWMFYYV